MEEPKNPPKQWKNMSEEEKKKYIKLASLRVFAQYLMIAVLIVALIWGGKNVETFKEYQNPCAFCIDNYELSCVDADNNPVRVVEGQFVTEKLIGIYDNLPQNPIKIPDKYLD